MNRLETVNGGIIVSVILGLGLSTIFAKSCGNKCTVVEPIDPNKLKGKVFKHEGKCMTFKPVYTKCE